MTDDYDRIFNTLFESYGTPEFERPPYRSPPEVWPRDLRALIQAASETDIKKDVRPDAAYFLLINFYQMVILPMRYRAESNANIGLGDVVEDIQLILKTAENISSGARISGNDVLAATSVLRERLRVNASEIWG